MLKSGSKRNKVKTLLAHQIDLSHSSRILPMASPLPEYVSGITVENIKSKKRRPLIKIFLDQQSRQVYDIGDVITGKVVIQPIHDVPFSDLTVDLAEIQSVIRSKHCLDIRIARSHSLVKHTPSLISFGDEKTLFKNKKYSFEFTIIIPEFRPPETCKSDLPLHKYIAPSLGSSLNSCSKYDFSDLSSHLYYLLRVRVTSRNPNDTKPIMEDNLDLRILPSNVPILNPHDLNVSSSNTCVVLKNSKIGQLEIKASTCPTIFIGRHICRQELMLYYQAIDTSVGPPSISCLTYKLLSHTVSSHTDLDCYPLPNDTACLTHTEVLCHRGVHNIKPNWIPSKENKFISCIFLPLEYKEHPRLLPTFYSCLISRQYELQINVAMNCSQCSLTIPVVLAYEGQKKNKIKY